MIIPMETELAASLAKKNVTHRTKPHKHHGKCCVPFQSLKFALQTSPFPPSLIAKYHSVSHSYSYCPQKSNHEPGNVPKSDFTPKSQPFNVTDGVPRHEHTWSLANTWNEGLPNVDLDSQAVKPLDINSLLSCLQKQIAQHTLGRADLG